MTAILDSLTLATDSARRQALPPHIQLRQKLQRAHGRVTKHFVVAARASWTDALDTPFRFRHWFILSCLYRHERRTHLPGKGRVTSTRSPPSLWLWKRMLPPWAWMTVRTTLRPKPTPPVALLRDGSRR